MSRPGRYTFVGFGLGAIQSGLFLYEAQAAGCFERLVVAEVVPDTVRQVRENGGFLTVNIAHRDHIEAARVGPVEVLNPAVEEDRCILVEAIAAAQEIATAVPSVTFYCSSPGPDAICRILAAGLEEKARRSGPRAVVYAAENHNHAAEILRGQVLDAMPEAVREGVLRQARFLNTVIGKMSGMIGDPVEIQALGLEPLTPGNRRAFLVEAFNRILISRIHFDEPGFTRGIAAFIEKDDLLPFEEAKLYGHNATHALATYLGALLGAQRIADLPAVPGMMAFLRRAFIEESGAALIRRHQGMDPLFTPMGYTAYADDLLGRMVNPYLSDTVERVGRDPERKLGWDDRLVGTVRLGLSTGIHPGRYALGVAAALVYLEPAYLDDSMDPIQRLSDLWGGGSGSPPAGQVLELIRQALAHLGRWRATGQADPHKLLAFPGR